MGLRIDGMDKTRMVPSNVENQRAVAQWVSERAKVRATVESRKVQVKRK